MLKEGSRGNKVRSVSEMFKKVQRYARNPSIRKKLNWGVAQMIARDCQPLSIVKDAGFRDLIHMLNPKYILLTRGTLTREILPQMCCEQKDVLKKKLFKANHVALTTDAWSSVTSTPDMVATAHFFEEDEVANITLISTIPHCPMVRESCTGEYVREELTSMSESFGIKEIIACVTDGGSNMVKGAKEMSIIHISCFNHPLNLCVSGFDKELRQRGGGEK